MHGRRISALGAGLLSNLLITGPVVADAGKFAIAAQPQQQKHAPAILPDAQHAFHADYRPSYRKGAATGGWNKLLQ